MTHTVNHALIAQPSIAWSGSHIYSNNCNNSNNNNNSNSNSNSNIYSNKSKVGGTSWPGSYMTITYMCIP